MDSDNKDRLFLFCGSGLMALLTLFCISIWFRYWPIAKEVGIALGSTLVILIISITLVSTGGGSGSLRWSRAFLWLALLGCAVALTLSILRATGVIG